MTKGVNERAGQSGECFVNQFSFNQRQRSAQRIMHHLMMIDAERMVHRGQEIFRANRAFQNVAPLSIRGTDDRASLGPAAGQQRCITSRPMVPAAAVARRDLRRARARMAAAQPFRRFREPTALRARSAAVAVATCTM